MPESATLDLGFVLPGDLLEAGGTVLPRRRSAGVCWASDTFGKCDFISLLGVGGKWSVEPSPGGLCCVAALVPKVFPCQAGNGVAVRTTGSPGRIQRPCRRAALRKGIDTGKRLERNFGHPRAQWCQAPL